MLVNGRRRIEDPDGYREERVKRIEDLPTLKLRRIKGKRLV